MKLFQFLLLCFCCFTVNLYGQGPVEYFFSDQTLCADDTLILPLQVRDFNKVKNFQSSVRWDSDKLFFQSLEGIHPELAGNFLVNTDSTDTGGLGYFWLDNTAGEPLVLPDNSVLFILKFTKSEYFQSTQVGFGEVPTLTETVVENNGTPMQVGSTQFFGQINNEVTAEATVQAANNSEDGAIDVTVITGQSPFSFFWNTGATTEDIEDLLPGTYTLTITDALGCTATYRYQVELNTATHDLHRQLIVAPNPVHDYLRINFITEQLDGVYQYKLYDSRTNLIFKKGNIKVNTNEQINLKNQPPGLYFLEIKTNENKQIFKIIKR